MSEYTKEQIEEAKEWLKDAAIWGWPLAKVILTAFEAAKKERDALAAALIESRRVVPRAINDIAGKLEEAIDSEDWNEAKSALNDLWDLRDDGYHAE